MAEYNKIIWSNQLSWSCELFTGKSYYADGGMEELWVVCVFICRKWSYAISGNMLTRINKNKLVSRKAFVGIVGIRSAYLIGKFSFENFAAFQTA